MRVTIVALLVGLASGLVALAAGRHLREIPLARVRWPALLVVAVPAYRAPAWLDASGALALGPVLAAYAGLVIFAAANVRLRGMAIVLLGLLCNAAVLVVNGAMPVDEEAVVAAGVAPSEELPRIELEAPREWRAPEHRLVLLADIIPVAALREVVSFGDLILAAGLANVVFRMLPPLVGPPSPGRSRQRGGGRRESLRRGRRHHEADEPHEAHEPEGPKESHEADEPEGPKEPHEAHEPEGPKESLQPEEKVPRDPAG